MVNPRRTDPQRAEVLTVRPETIEPGLIGPCPANPLTIGPTAHLLSPLDEENAAQTHLRADRPLAVHRLAQPHLPFLGGEIKPKLAANFLSNPIRIAVLTNPDVLRLNRELSQSPDKHHSFYIDFRVRFLNTY